MHPSQLLPGRYVALDFETTGLRPGRDRIIEVGAIECVDGVPGRTLSRLVAPGTSLPAHVVMLTGITDQDLVDAPRIDDVLPELLAFLGEDPILAHNAGFEQAFLESALGRPLGNAFLDTIELCGLLRAEDPRRSLDRLVRLYDIRSAAEHRGLDDARDCLSLVLRLLGDLATAGKKGLVERLVATLGGTDWPWLGLFQHLATVLPEPPLDDTPRARRRRPSPREQPARPTQVTHVAVDGYLAPRGELASHFSSWEPRRSQREMAYAVADALGGGKKVMVEAPTGVGKSLAYLIPAALFARANGVPVMIATHTKNLQDQLAEKELELVSRVIPGLTWRIVKGQENYLCRRRTRRWLDEGPSLLDDLKSRTVRGYVEAFLGATADGDLERFLPWISVQGPHVPRAVAEIRSTGATCLHQRCPWFHSCFYQDVAYGTHEADLLITNHALALTWPERYATSMHLIVDEAHALEDAITQAFSARFDPVETLGVLDRLSGGAVGRGGLFAQAPRVAEELSLAPEARGWIGSAARTVEGLRGELRAIAEDGTGLVQRAATQVEDRRQVLRVTESLVASSPFEGFRSRAHHVADRMASLSSEVGAFIDAVFEVDPGHPFGRELVSHAEPLAKGAKVLGEVVGEPREGFVYWLETEESRLGTLLRAESAPINVRDLAREQLFDRYQSVVLTSATLRAGGRGGFGYVAERLGFDRLRAADRAGLVEVESPFDLPRQLVVGIPDDLADLNQGQAFVADVARVIADVARMLGGRTLALFAANRRRDLVAERLERELAGDGIEVLNQGSGLGRQRMAEALREGGRRVLLGSRSFWEGVDVPGSALSAVIIEKLPFDFPGHPVHRAREEDVVAGGGDPFLDYTLPKALLRFRQGVGRLVRTATDHGFVLLLQSNLHRKAYKSRVEACLPGVPILGGPWHELRDELEVRMVELATTTAAPRAAGRPR